jgi:hypothetical protein
MSVSPALFGERVTRDAFARRIPIAVAGVDQVARSPKPVRACLVINNCNGDCAMGKSLEPDRWKASDTTGNHRGISFTEFDLQLLTPAQLEAYSHTKAFNEAIRHDPRTDQQIAKHAKVSKGHLSKLRSGLWEEQAKRLESILFEVGHIGPAQKLLHDLGFTVTRRKRKKGQM